MQVWILMGDAGCYTDSDIAICGVFKTRGAAFLACLQESLACPEDTYWIEEWEVE